MVQQYKQKAEADKRQAIARHKAVADETEELLLNVNLVPFSKNMVLLMQHRILDAYRAIALVMPNVQIKQRIADVQTQIKNVQENLAARTRGTSRRRVRPPGHPDAATGQEDAGRAAGRAQQGAR